MTTELRPVPLTRERFAPYGEVIDTAADADTGMNAARFSLFPGLGRVDVDGDAAIGIARCRVATGFPHRIDFVERHPLGSQAFVPLSPAKMIVVVAPPGEGVSAGDLRAFVSNGRQGINYRRGTWHMPLIALQAGQEFLVVDRARGTPNLDEHYLDETVVLTGPG